VKSSGLILFCSCEGRNLVPGGVNETVLSGLQALGTGFTAVPDLCGIAAKRGKELKETVDKADRILVIACYPRAVKWLFNIAGIEWNTAKISVINMRKENPDTIIGTIKTFSSTCHDSCAGVELGGDDSKWDPWFPVIDYDRCEGCKQCMSFCLFGVYAEGGKHKVEVANAAGCKTNCPACARICPTAAIIFPKYTEPPIDGAEINDEESVRQKIKINVNEILGDDIYAALAERRRKAKKLLVKKPDVEQAEQERKKFSGQ
jgi:NAD-dependent dihydropyrimidine dehydrogenase PreA subunit